MRLTIVTPTLNRAEFLPAAIESVLAQGYPDFEHIIVDGLSTDDTPAVLARYPHLRLLREGDRGLYDALNKGLRLATGEVIGHLNSDDTYAPGAFHAVAAAFADPAVEAVSGGAETLLPGGAPGPAWNRPEHRPLSFHNATLGTPIPNARFFRRSFYERVGLYSLAYRVAADRDFLFRACLARPRTAELAQTLYRYHQHEGSLTFGCDPAREARWRDEYLALAEHYLARADLPAEARRVTRRWHERESAQAALRAGAPGRFLAAARRGWAVNRTWPWMFLRHLGGALLGR